MTRAHLHDMRLRALAGIALTEDEQLALIEACERLVDAVCADPRAGEHSSTLGTIGREAINIVREIRFS